MRREYHEGIRMVSCLFPGRMFERVGKEPPAPLEDLAEILLALSMTLSLPNPSTPDRRRPLPHTADMLLAFKAIVRGGSLESRGRPKFGELGDDDLQALRHYIGQRARDLANAK